MIEIYDECKSAIINKKCSECNEFYSCYICDFVEERYQQGRKDAIDEFVKAFKDNMLKSTTPTWMCYVEEIAKQLKEKNK